MTVQVDVHTHWRLVLVGQPMSGKRTIAQGLLNAAGATRRAAAVAQFGDVGSSHKADKTSSLAEECLRRLQLHGSGMSQAFMAAAAADAQTPLGTGAPSIEVFIVDHPTALHVALPTLDSLHRCLILFVIDLAMPETAEEQLLSWRRHVHNHVKAVSGGGATLQELINASKALIESERATVDASSTPLVDALKAEFTSLTSTPPSHGAAPFAPSADICPVKGLVVANKLDVLEKRFFATGASKSTVYDTKLSRVQFMLHSLRLLAVRQCCGLVQLSATHTPAPMFKLLLTYVEGDFNMRASASSSEGDAPEDAKRSALTAVMRDAVAAIHSSSAGAQASNSLRLLPAGWDSEALIHPFVRTNSLDARSAMFQQADDKTIDHAADVVSHEALLSEMEMTMEETPVWDMV